MFTETITGFSYNYSSCSVYMENRTNIFVYLHNNEILMSCRQNVWNRCCITFNETFFLEISTQKNYYSIILVRLCNTVNLEETKCLHCNQNAIIIKHNFSTKSQVVIISFMKNYHKAGDSLYTVIMDIEYKQLLTLAHTRLQRLICLRVRDKLAGNTGSPFKMFKTSNIQRSMTAPSFTAVFAKTNKSRSLLSVVGILWRR